MKLVFFPIFFCLTIIAINSYADYKIILGYDFFSNLHIKHKYNLANSIDYSFIQDYKLNVVGASIGLGSYVDEKILLTIEGIMSSDYVANDCLPSFSNYVVPLDYSKVFHMGVIAGFYYNFYTKDNIVYYLALGTGMSRIYSLMDKFHIFPYLIQGKIGMKYINMQLVKPYVAYKYIYMRELSQRWHKMDFIAHNFECGMEVSTGI